MLLKMDALTLFGLVAVAAMLIFYALEKRSHWFILAFAGSCVSASAYGFLQGAWPFGLVEAVHCCDPALVGRKTLVAEVMWVLSRNRLGGEAMNTGITIDFKYIADLHKVFMGSL